MQISEFDYHLPKELIAQHSVEPRDHSRLMVLDRQAQTIEHKHFFDIFDYLHEGDVLVLNKTKVFKARLYANTECWQGVEVFLLRPEGEVWEAMLKPGRRVNIGDELIFEGGLRAQLMAKRQDASAICTLQFNAKDDQVFAYCEAHGHIPVPPYVKDEPQAFDQYQTVYAQERGSVAAPTAGFHFTQELLDRVQQKGVQIEYVTLHVGIGTFQPVKVDQLEEHKMHSEVVLIEAEVAQRINQAKQEGRRIIAVGTTTTRALEGVAALQNLPQPLLRKEGGQESSSPPYEGGGNLPVEAPTGAKSGGGSSNLLPTCGFVGEVNVFITPGFSFHIIDALITNFHLPKSTLLVLVSSFAGTGFVRKAYSEAVDHEYRFYSFGDVMFIQ